MRLRGGLPPQRLSGEAFTSHHPQPPLSGCPPVLPPMKKPTPFRIVVFAIGVLIATTATAAPRIGFVLKGPTGFWAETEKGARAAAGKAGAELLVKTPPSEDSVAVQIRLAEALAEQGIDVLIIAPSDPKTVGAAVEKLAEKGVKIVAIDSPLETKACVAFVGTDQEAAGGAAGRLISTLVQATDEVAFFKASKIHSGGATEFREAGATNALRVSQPNLPIHGNIIAGSDAVIAADRANQLLGRYPNVKLVFASSTLGTLSMLHALEQKKSAGAIKLIGFGYNLNPEVDQALQKGRLTAWIAQLPSEVGKRAVETALDVAAGKTVPSFVHTEYLVVTLANVRDPSGQALLSQ